MATRLRIQDESTVDVTGDGFKETRASAAKPVLKWAGGKTQLLRVLERYVPDSYRSYIEPFFGGGALFFALAPKPAVVADSNPELINVYRTLVDDVESVITRLRDFENTEEMFYEVRALSYEALDPIAAAARTIYLNRTCFNGLYRVNRSGQFNTPFGRYKNPKICDSTKLRAAARVLAGARIVQDDFRELLASEARPGDFIYLDPPYVPVSKYADFKRYTKEQFCEQDHIELAKEARRLRELGCHVLLTNSNHSLVHDLYADFRIEVVDTRRNVNSVGGKREGQDLVIYGAPMTRRTMAAPESDLKDINQTWKTWLKRAVPKPDLNKN